MIVCFSEFIEDILSPDENSMNSSRISNKSEKNLADFDGEDMLSDEELALIHNRASTAASSNNPHELLQQQLAHMANLYGSSVVPNTSKRGSHAFSIARGK